ncbi:MULTISPECIES: undecaprenyl-diphosphate phosphatase [unclassified Desulfobacter]|jgi:undecaprenyl-diphosphatase|uniref:undecaprenyl-diphosphate phosphatase n=1 Tax=unclassified Desulfobacter TaxID=2634406 RepID=UPI000E871FBA|nr:MULTISPECIES: undecaprenyl-diphosphate phosphatase [unclassified Desulfobacter]MBP8829424.1 undecaprenyl-diphosphate phosphatase [Desulfobacter sp.]MBP9597963.1 undecaprenyl-diphosphate phosphatase [Desulfobacter sp.]HBT88258.1 UDP-diphosphatase [Desulfobacter sp.]
MEIYQGIILGILQGLTEFLPVSSSGHLVLGQIYFNITENSLIFDISVHMGTLLAIFIVYFKDIQGILKSLVYYAGTRNTSGHETNLALAAAIVVGSVPTAIIGFSLKKFEDVLFTSSLLVGTMLIVTGGLLWVSRRYYRIEKGEQLTISRAFIIGIVQGIAVIPGISRSGSTIATGLFTGLERKTAARFSFLLSIPAILGAQVISVKDLVESGGHIDPATICGTIASFIVGLAALKLLLKLVNTGKFHLFAPYCWLAGILALVSNFI